MTHPSQKLIQIPHLPPVVMQYPHWNLGIKQGLYCLGCCWALMLVMFVVGAEHLTWMLLLTGVMALEKT